MSPKLLTILALSFLLAACAFGGSQGFPGVLQKAQAATSNLASASTASNSLPVLLFSTLLKLLKCFQVDEVADALESFVKGVDLPHLAFNNSLVNATSNLGNPSLESDLLSGNGLNWQWTMACGQWVANATAASKTCLLNGDQTLVDEVVLNGNQTLLCGGTASNNYVQFLNGLLKFYMTNSKDTPFDGYISLGPLGVAKGTFWWDGFVMYFPQNALVVKFNPHQGAK